MQCVGEGFEASLEYLKILHYNHEWLLLDRANYVENKKLRLWVYIFVGTSTLFGVNIFFFVIKSYI